MCLKKSIHETTIYAMNISITCDSYLPPSFIIIIFVKVVLLCDAVFPNSVTARFVLK